MSSLIFVYIVMTLSSIILILYILFMCKRDKHIFCKKNKSKNICIRLNSITYSTNSDEKKTTSSISSTLNSSDSSLASCGEIYENFRSSKREKSFIIKNENEDIEVEVIDDIDEFELDSINGDNNLNWDSAIYENTQQNIVITDDHISQDSIVYDLPPPSHIPDYELESVDLDLYSLPPDATTNESDNNNDYLEYSDNFV
ncbi:EEV glycoprotein [Swinepox virus]|uniref:EEV glycoprotein n=1 Tax=Swinepox virus TaxID=10276 RepID=A0A881SY82_SWPV|nr:EEV glycoprotein [Swinepox virus]